jgi:curved DNA-binding protein CbpA
MVEWLREKPAAAPRSPTRASLRGQILGAYDRLEGQSHREVLGVPEGASPAEIQAAFGRLARLYHPDAHHAPDLLDLKEKLEELFMRVTEAHRVLSRGRNLAPAVVKDVPPPPAAVPPPPEVPAPAAKSPDELIDRATESLAAGRYWETLAAVDEAFPQAQGRLRRRARVLKAQALLKGEGGRRAAEEELKAALDEDRGNGDAHFLLGTIYKSRNANALAAASFKRVLDLKPRHAEALEALTSLEAGEAEKGRPSGLLGFFKRS